MLRPVVGEKKSFDILSACQCRQTVKSSHEKWKRKKKKSTRSIAMGLSVDLCGRGDCEWERTQSAHSCLVPFIAGYLFGRLLLSFPLIHRVSAISNLICRWFNSSHSITCYSCLSLWFSFVPLRWPSVIAVRQFTCAQKWLAKHKCIGRRGHEHGPVYVNKLRGKLRIRNASALSVCHRWVAVAVVVSILWSSFTDAAMRRRWWCWLPLRLR